METSFSEKDIHIQNIEEINRESSNLIKILKDANQEKDRVISRLTSDIVNLQADLAKTLQWRGCHG